MGDIWQARSNRNCWCVPCCLERHFWLALTTLAYVTSISHAASRHDAHCTVSDALCRAMPSSSLLQAERGKQLSALNITRTCPPYSTPKCSLPYKIGCLQDADGCKTECTCCPPYATPRCSDGWTI